MRLSFSYLLVAGWSTAVLLQTALAVDPDKELIQQISSALIQGKTQEALKLASHAIARHPRSSRAYLLRGSIYEMLDQHREAIADFDKSIALNPKAAEAYDHRGSEHFKLGNIAASLADFDKFLAIKPEAQAGHWKRGISLYYAGRFDDGRKQFESYEDVDTNDVENAVWHFLCVARLAGFEKAQKSILKIGKDQRVPLMQVYALYRGQTKPDDVLAAAKAGHPKAEELRKRLFHAHLYLGLYWEVKDDKKQALMYLNRAAKDSQVGQYMGDVARVHRDLLRKKMDKNPDPKQ